MKFCFKLWKYATETYVILAWIEYQFLSGITDSRKAESMWGMKRGVEGVRNSIHRSWMANGLRLGLLCWGFKGVQEEIFFLNRVSCISTRTIHQSTTLSLSQTIWPTWATRQFPTLPIVQTLLSGYSLSSEAFVMKQLRRWKWS